MGLMVHCDVCGTVCDEDSQVRVDVRQPLADMPTKTTFSMTDHLCRECGRKFVDMWLIVTNAAKATAIQSTEKK